MSTSRGKAPGTETSSLRCIAHVDMDCFYAQVEAVRLGIDCRTVPFIVAQWGALIAVNYPARKLGIARLHNLSQARELCPSVYVSSVATYKVGEKDYHYHAFPHRQTHKVALEPYRQASRKIFDILRTTPGVRVEKGSVDEAYLDVTVAAREELATLRAAHASAAPGGAAELTPEDVMEPSTRLIEDRSAEMEAWFAAHGTSLEAAYNGPMRALKRGEAGEAARALEGSRAYSVAGASGHAEVGAQQNMSAEEVAEFRESSLLLCAASRVVRRIRDAVYAELHYDCSAGIAHNRLLAKCISATHKPNQQTLLLPDRTASALFELPLTKLRGFGGKFGRAVEAVCGGATLCREAWLVPLVQFRLLTGDIDWGQEEAEEHAGGNQRRRRLRTAKREQNDDTNFSSLSRAEERIPDEGGAIGLSTSALYTYYRMRGLDEDTVSTHFFSKTLMASKVFQPATTDLESIRMWLVVLCSELASRYEEFSHIFQVKGHNFNVKLGGSSFHNISDVANRTIALPEVVSADSLLAAAMREVQLAMKPEPRLVDSVSITIGGLAPTTEAGLKGQQQTLTSFFTKRAISPTAAEARAATPIEVGSQDAVVYCCSSTSADGSLNTTHPGQKRTRSEGTSRPPSPLAMSVVSSCEDENAVQASAGPVYITQADSLEDQNTLYEDDEDGVVIVE